MNGPLSQFFVPKILTVAGTDPSAGAGIQADLKTISALCSYGCSVITAVVAQNTQGVQGVSMVSAPMVRAQLESVFHDITLDAVKIGMLGNVAIIQEVSKALEEFRPPVVVLDPVMQAKSGDSLLDAEALVALGNLMLKVDLVTPNLPEAAKILKVRVAKTEAEMVEQGAKFIALGCKNVLLKGGHLPGDEVVDWFFSPSGHTRHAHPRIDTLHTHGTGCSLSAALAALYPRYNEWQTTVTAAINWLTPAILAADKLAVGKGQGPLHHFYQYW